LIGKFKLTDIPAKPKGVPQIEVTFDIDADGIIKVSAKDKDTGKNSSITVFGKTGMSTAEIEDMINKSKEAIKEDQNRLSYLKHVNNLELLVFDTEQAVKDWGKFMLPEDLANVQKHVETVKRMIADSRSGDLFNVELIQAAQNEIKEETLEVVTRAAQRNRASKK